MKPVLLLALAGSALAAGLVSQGIAARAQDPQVRTTHVAGPVHMIEGRGGNLGVSSGEDGQFLIDDQFANMVPAIRAALAELGEGPLRYLVNTHYHGDHTGGNAALSGIATIFAHENVRVRMSSEQRRGERVTPPSPAEALPVVTFEDGVSFHMNGEKIRVLHVPDAHTDGDSIVWFTGSNVLHMGDLFFSGRFPFVDVDSGGSVSGLLAGVQRILGQLPEDAKIIPGHGPLSTKADLLLYRDMISECAELVQERMEEGMSVDDSVAAGLPEQWKDWSWNFINEENWIRTLHRSLAE